MLFLQNFYIFFVFFMQGRVLRDLQLVARHGENWFLKETVQNR